MQKAVTDQQGTQWGLWSKPKSFYLLKKTLTDLKIESISIHGLRHTHASVLLYKKISIYYVSERLGHAKIDTTLNYYSHVIKELREEDTRNTLDLFEKMPTVKTFV
ncbi:tyrosine-type recombinase/integrase [Bacillus atrophaeus]|uniref:tyrosine-type recombinase/integrase n=1 Tax=Bacillus atrophaeus TaxID=1452 RepID=UPI001F462256|nr:tyrosine-type recombinase/integrase [Bacillus atrophaeus]